MAPGRVSQIGEVVQGLERLIRVRKSFKLGELVRSSGRHGEPVQDWFRYRDGYSLRLAGHLLRGVPAGSLVVDPCCGTGATLLAARNHGYRSVGIDTNPLATFAARTKTRTYERDQVQELRKSSNAMTRITPADPADAAPDLRRIESVFAPGVLHALLVIRHRIGQEPTDASRDFFRLAWLSILEEVSNLQRVGSLKYRNRRRLYEGGYEVTPLDEWQSEAFPDDQFAYTRGVFLSRAQKMITDLDSSFTPVTIRSRRVGCHQPLILDGSATDMNPLVEPDSASLVLFSPPYPNQLNYVNAYRIELWMGGFIKSYRDRKALNRQSVRSHLDTPLTREYDRTDSFPDELEALISLMDAGALWDSRLPQMIRGYFHDLERVLEKSLGVLRPGGKCVLVVGSSAYGGVVFPIDLLLARVAEGKGFVVEKIAVARSLPTSSQQALALKPLRRYLRESVLFLRKD